MTARLPIPGHDDGVWGDILNGFLEVAHNGDGTLQPNAIQSAGGAMSSQVGAANGIAGLNGSSQVPAVQLGAGTASSSNFLRGDGVWAVPSGSGGGTLSSDTDVAITSPTNNQVLTYNSGTSKWVNQNAPSAPVSSVFGRTGAVTPQSGDYTAAQVGALPSTDDLSAIATANATTGNVSLNSHKITGLANGTTATDAAAFGQIPTSASNIGGLLAANNLSDVGSVVTARGNLGAAQSLTPTAVKTSAYTASAGDFIPVDVSGGGVTITLPTAPADKSRVEVKMVNISGSNTVTITTGGTDVFNKSGGPTSGSLTLLNQALMLQYASSGGIWYVQSDDLPLSQLDSRYGLLSGATFTGAVTAPDFAPSGLTGATAVSRYVGATTSGAPASGTFNKGDYVIDQTATIWICTTAGSPGTWTQISSSGGGVSLDTNASDIQALGSSAAAGGTGKASDAGHVHPTTGLMLATGGGQEQIVTNTNATGSVTLNLTNGNVFNLTLTGSVTLAFSGATNGVACSFTLYLTQDNTGGRSVTWPGSVSWIGGVAPTLTTTANAINVLVFETLNGGTTWFGSTIGIVPTMPLGVASGGTGLASMGSYQLLTGGTTSTGQAQQVSGTGTSGQILTSNGSGTLPTWQTSASVGWAPGDNGLLTASADPFAASLGTNQAGSARLYLVKLPIRLSMTITSLWVFVATAATGTSTNSYVGLYSSGGTLLSGSSDVGTAVSSTGAIQIALTTPQSVSAGFVWAAMVFNGLTANPKMQSGAGIPNVGLAASTLRFAVNGQSGISTLPPSLTVSNNSQSNAVSWWVGAS